MGQIEKNTSATNKTYITQNIIYCHISSFQRRQRNPVVHEYNFTKLILHINLYRDTKTLTLAVQAANQACSAYISGHVTFSILVFDLSWDFAYHIQPNKRKKNKLKTLMKKNSKNTWANEIEI